MTPDVYITEVDGNHTNLHYIAMGTDYVLTLTGEQVLQLYKSIDENLNSNPRYYEDDQRRTAKAT